MSSEEDLQLFRLPDGLRLYRGQRLLARGDRDVLTYIVLTDDLPDPGSLFQRASALLPS